MALYSLPLLFRSPAEVQYVRRQMDHVIIEGLKKRGFVSFGLGDGGFAYFMSNKPLASAAQLRHQKVWIPQGDRISEATLQAFGVSPVPLPLTDVLTGLQTGLIDTVAVSPVGAIALQWHTRVRYLTHVPLLYLFGTIVIQQKALNRLSDDDKKVVADVMRKTSTKIGQQAAKDNKAALQALKKQGVKFIEPSAAERRRWHDRVQSAIVKLGREHAYSAEGLRKIRAYLDEYRKRSSQK